MALSGMEETTSMMFGFMGSKSTLAQAPTAEEMEDAQQAALFKKTVIFKSVEIKTFDLSVPEQALAYADMIKMLYIGAQMKTHLVLQHDKRFVEQPTARWLAHLEWATYELKIEANEVLKPAGTGDTNGQAGI